MFKGRNADAKRQLYQALINNLSQSPGIDGDDIIIVLHKPPFINWGIKSGRPASEVDLGFDINV